MKVARLHSYEEEHFHLDDVPSPEIRGAHDVIIRIGGAGLCRTDLHVIEGIWRGIQNPELPYTLGHENAGWVEDVGDSVTSAAPGRRRHRSSSDHRRSVLGLPRRGGPYCENGVFPGLNADGGFAECLLTAERLALKLQGDLEPKAAAPYADAGLTAPKGCVWFRVPEV